MLTTLSGDMDARTCLASPAASCSARSKLRGIVVELTIDAADIETTERFGNARCQHQEPRE